MPSALHGRSASIGSAVNTPPAMTSGAQAISKRRKRGDSASSSRNETMNIRPEAATAPKQRLPTAISVAASRPITM
jgi:hypothetical protein